ncbi:MAG: hypothetical protein IJ877_00750 [Candidatus Gastranaerophilales bacterium]|nr:hypothetical protein [Candidatus Gastranaerophilales bacterium]
MKINALELFLKQRRFDLIFKYLYLKYPDNPYAKYAYIENIRAFNNFFEECPSSGIPKNSKEDFINTFDEIYKSIKNEGFNPAFGVIPISNQGEIADGAHRLAVCACLNKDIEVRDIGFSDNLYDYRLFRYRKMDESAMDWGALEYVKLNQNAYIVNLHSAVVHNLDEEVEKILEKYGFIYYKKEIQLSLNAYVNLNKLSYGSFWQGANWIGNVENKFKGAKKHAELSRGKGVNPLRAYVFVCDNFDNVLKAKSEIRKLCNLGNYSVHINDTREEAIWLAMTYFNKNSLDLINIRPFAYEDYKFDSYIDELKKLAFDKNIDLDDICASGSTPLDVFGIRKSQDLDFLYCGSGDFYIQTGVLSNHDSQLEYYPYSKKEIIKNPEYHFYYKGLKFISLNVLYEMKKKRGEVPKDINDCKDIKRALKRSKPPFRIYQKIKSGPNRMIVLFECIRIRYKKRKK